MSFYAPEAHLQSEDGMTHDHDQIRPWLLRLWNNSPYLITNMPLVIYGDGQRLTFTSVELYKRGTQESGYALNNRFVWQKQPLQRGSQKHAWLIVEQAYLDSEVSAR